MKNRRDPSRPIRPPDWPRAASPPAAPPLNYALPQPDRPTAPALLYWLAGAAAILGVRLTIAFALRFSFLSLLIRDLVLHPRFSPVADGLRIAYLLIDGLSALAMIAAGWWCLLGERWGIRTLRIACIGLLVSPALDFVISIWSPGTGSFWKPHPDGGEYFFEVYYTARHTIWNATLPMLLLAATMNEVTVQLLRCPREADAPQTAAAARHLRLCIAWVAIVIGAMEITRTMATTFIFQRDIRWIRIANWSAEPLFLLQGMLGDVSGLLLAIGGGMMFRRPAARAVVIIGALAAVARFVLFFAPHRGSWNYIIVGDAVFQLMYDFCIIVALILIIGLLTRRAMREI